METAIVLTVLRITENCCQLSSFNCLGLEVSCFLLLSFLQISVHHRLHFYSDCLRRSVNQTCNDCVSAYPLAAATKRAMIVYLLFRWRGHAGPVSVVCRASTWNASMPKPSCRPSSRASDYQSILARTVLTSEYQRTSKGLPWQFFS